MTKTIKKSYVNYLIMKEFGEEIESIKNGVIAELKEERGCVEKRLISCVKKENNEYFEMYKKQLLELDESIQKAYSNILEFDFSGFYTMDDELSSKIEELFEIMNIEKQLNQKGDN